MVNHDSEEFPFQPSISKEEISELEQFSYTGKITIIDSDEKLNQFSLRPPADGIVGFDTETKPAFKKGVYNQCSLVQLAFEEEVVLFRLNRIGFPPVLAELLTQPSMVKIGIAIHDDIKQLQQIQHFNPERFMDLNVVCPTIGFESIGAKRLTALVLGKRISKRQQVSNWEARELSEAQLRYAATDAWICREIFLKLNGLGLLSPKMI